METEWNKCPYTNKVCSRLLQGHSCLLEGNYVTVRMLKLICGLDNKMILRLIDEGSVKAPYKPKPR